MDTVEMYHPELHTHIQVPASAVPIHRNSGWITGRDDNPQFVAPMVSEDTEALPTGEPGPRPAGEASPDTERDLPAKSAPKSDWEQAARDAGIPDEDINSMTKDELVARLTGTKE